MENKIYKKGSEWRKWDLHIHSPASFFWKGGKTLHNLSEEEKREELKKFIKIVNDSDIAIFSLMDYWTFDWYIELNDNAHLN